MITFKIIGHGTDSSSQNEGAKLACNREGSDLNVLIELSNPKMTAVLSFMNAANDKALSDYVNHPITEYGCSFAPPKASLTILFLFFLANAKENMPVNSYIYELLDRARGLMVSANFDTFKFFDGKVDSKNIDEHKFWAALDALQNHLNESSLARILTSAPPAPSQALQSFVSQEGESGCSILFMPCFIPFLIVYLVLYPIFFMLDYCLSSESKDESSERCLLDPRRIFNAYWHNDGLHSDFQVIFSSCFLTLFLAYALVAYPMAQLIGSCCHFEGDRRDEGEREPLCP